MYEAAETNASAGAIGAIVAVAVACLAFWLIAMALASRDPGVGRPRTSSQPGPVLGGTHVSECHRSVAPNRDSAATFADAEADAFGAGARAAPASATDGGPEDADIRDAAADAPARTGPGAGAVPTPRKEDQPTGQPSSTQPSPTAAQVTPGQRTADADQPRHTGTER
ncbi:MAG TPA: hypothetical protein VF060_10190 [Trebonia sp.]